METNGGGNELASPVSISFSVLVISGGEFWRARWSRPSCLRAISTSGLCQPRNASAPVVDVDVWMPRAALAAPPMHTLIFFRSWALGVHVEEPK